jgi:beta-glucosidase
MNKSITLLLLAVLIFQGCNSDSNKDKDPIAIKVDSIINLMTLEEKIGQLTLYTSGWTVTGPKINDNYLEDIKAGKCGNIFNAHTAAYNYDLQKTAMEETRLGIPLLFGYDVIHGYKTIFPIPLAEACSWDMGLIKKNAALSAKEAAAGGLHWTFNPMVDISRDPRWGRIAEGSGEDPYLGSLIGAAKVKGYQGDDLSDPFTLLACVKHFAAYGAAQAGRDYHTVDISERSLMEVQYPPYKAAIDAGVATVMTSFNEINGVPSSGNKELLTDLLRDKWGFEGFVVTDYTSINEMVPHGFSRDLEHAAEQAINAGVDMDMQGGAFQYNLDTLVKMGRVSEARINKAVADILKMKYKLGLFDDPYRYSNVEREKEVIYSKEIMDQAQLAAEKSIVLLKNAPVNGAPLLPISKSVKSIALIGPLADNRIDLLGSWHASGGGSPTKTMLEALRNEFPEAEITYAQGAGFTGSDQSGFAEAVSAANKADIVIMAIGENYQQSGEAASRSFIGLPGPQEDLVKAVHATGKPIVALVMAGRPLTIGWLEGNIPAVVNTWHLGTMAAPAIANMLSGDVNPSGKLTITFPRSVGQIPIFYAMKSTGRPFDAKNKYTSKYLDVSNQPLYPFGYGLSYTKFNYSELTIDRPQITKNEVVNVSITVTNSGKYDGEEVVQLYLQDVVGSVTRPVKELKGYQKITLKSGESKTLNFKVTNEDLKFYTRSMNWDSEPGKFKVFVGTNSRDVLEAPFELMN